MVHLKFLGYIYRIIQRSLHQQVRVEVVTYKMSYREVGHMAMLKCLFCENIEL